jgi:predicted lipoprotein with Yx(FWY)xxD motif
MQSHVRIAIAVAVTGLLVAVAAGSALAATRKHVVITTKSAALHKRVLATRSGLTLYSLNAERRGKFICTDGTCLSFWHPLLVPTGTKPTGTSHLGTIARPGSKGRQVTFRGLPLYTFYLDHSRGDAGGEGFKDVGTWHAATAPR